MRLRALALKRWPLAIAIGAIGVIFIAIALAVGPKPSSAPAHRAAATHRASQVAAPASAQSCPAGMVLDSYDACTPEPTATVTPTPSSAAKRQATAEPTAAPKQSTEKPPSTVASTEKPPTRMPTRPTPSSAPPTPAAPPAITGSQQQAIDAAQGYLDLGSGFSRQGLIDQLTSHYGNGFSTADATFAVDYLHPDWDAQAVESAKGYLALGTGFSRQGLIDQLTSPYGSKFTYGQAVYAVNRVGL